MSLFGYRMLSSVGRVSDPDAATHIARLTSTDPNLERDINNLVLNLKAYGVWDILDDLCVIHKNVADSLLGIKGFADSTKVESGTATITYSSTLGLNCSQDGAGNYAYINTNLDSLVGSSNMATDDMSIFAFRTAESNGVVGANGFMGSWNSANDDGTVLKGNTSSPIVSFFGGSDASAIVSLVESADSFIGGTRTGASAIEIRHDGSTATDTDASTGGAATYDMLVGCYNLNGTAFFPPGDHDFAAWGAGGGLTSQQLSDLRTSIQTYMNSRGV